MSKEHKISWLNMPGFKPETWNPIVGCSKVSPGCDNCYAERMANRLSVALGAKGTEPSDSWIAYSDVITNGKWNGKTALVKSALDKPLKWKEPRMIFVCSMGDLFHESVSFETIDRIYDIIRQNQKHIYIILTKRPERVYKYWDWILRKTAGVGIQDIELKSKDNVWLGVTAENQEQADKRIPILLKIPAAKHFVSIEPMLGPVDLINLDNGKADAFNHSNGKLDWVICGGETGHKARPIHPDWVRSLRDQCKSADVPFFFKQWGTLAPFSTVDGRQILPFDYMKYNPETKEGYVRGRKDDRLDGQQHHEWPKINL